MSKGNSEIYPECRGIIRKIEVGGLTKTQLFQKMQKHSICMNDFANMLLNDVNFTTSTKPYTLETVELTVCDLGLPKGGTTTQIYNRANQLGLELCPLELGPHLRLAYLEQPEGYSGQPKLQNQAPYGSITIASETLSEDVNYPKGFYLKRVEGVLWLRGYIADELHVWGPDDHFIFCKSVEDQNRTDKEG